MKYRELMDTVYVDSNMKSRILKDLEEVKVEDIHEEKKNTPFLSIKRYSSLVAGFLLFLVLGGIFGYNLKSMEEEKVKNEEPIILEDSYTVSNYAASNVIVCETLQELSEKVGFEIENLKSVPFKIVDSEYKLYWGEVAEIKYIGESNSVTYRKSKGFSDLSGSHINYDEEKEIENNGITLTLKGSNGLYNVVLWDAEGCSCSLRLENPMNEKTILQIFNY